MYKKLLLCLFVCASCFGQADRFAQEVSEISKEKQALIGQKNIVLFTGSSSIRLWTNLEQDFDDLAIVNTGFGGSEFSDLLFFREQLIGQFEPVKIFIYEGDNDINSGKSPGKTFRQAKKLYRKLRREVPNAQLYFISAKPSIARWSKKAEYLTFNKLLEKFSKRKSLQFVDVWNAMLDETGNVKQDIFIEDNLHMNSKGYAIWKMVMKPYLTD